jgi:branched-chain amino acid transport system substrate-binding protein
MKCMQAAILREICGRISKSGLAGLVLLALGSIVPLQAQEPIKIGFGVSLTGGLASSGKAHLLSKQIWLEELNAKGGLLGRPVARLFRRPDQRRQRSRHLLKLMDVDKVDLLMGHATISSSPPCRTSWPATRW